MKFRTAVNIDKVVGFFDHSQRIISIGSCFSNNVGELLNRDGFTVQNNDFGVLFNPISIQNNIQNSLQNIIPEHLIIEREGRFYHYNLPSHFSGDSESELTTSIRMAQADFRTGITAANKLLLTFGTAWVYKLISGGDTVANCHKIPQKEFRKELLDLEILKIDYFRLFKELKKANSRLEIVLTVSPVRHKKDGLRENNLSKSILLLLTEYLVKSFDFVHYFPAYELVIDDLRDYRFYNEDMIHPTEQAINYVYNHFQETYFSTQSVEIAKLSRKLFQLKSHKSLGQSNESDLAKQENFVLEIKAKIDQLKGKL